MRFIIITEDEEVYKNLSSSIYGMEEEFSFLKNVRVEWCSSLEYDKDCCRADEELCIVIDIDLLNGNGLKLAEELRKRDESLPLVICSALNDYAMQCYDLDVVFYMLKPLTEESIRLMISRIERRREADEV